MDQYVERVVDLIDPEANALLGTTVEAAREAVWSGDPARVRALRGSFALAARQGKTVRMARSLDRPLRYFLAKRAEGPALFIASRIDVLYHALQKEGLEEQFHPSYTRMVPAHHISELQLIGCPDPSPVHVRFFDPEQNGPVTDTAAGIVTIAVPGLGAIKAATSKVPSPGAQGAVALRPEKVRLHAPGNVAAADNRFPGTVTGFLYQGDVTVYMVRSAQGQQLEALLANSASGLAKFFETGDAVEMSWPADAGHFIEG